MNSDNQQSRLTFGLAVFICGRWTPKKSRQGRRLKGKFGELFSECLDYPYPLPGSEINSDYAGDRRPLRLAMKRGRSGWGIYRTGLVRYVRVDYPTD
jgi:hypothetical protein